MYHDTESRRKQQNDEACSTCHKNCYLLLITYTDSMTRFLTVFFKEYLLFFIFFILFAPNVLYMLRRLSQYFLCVNKFNNIFL